MTKRGVNLSVAEEPPTPCHSERSRGILRLALQANSISNFYTHNPTYQMIAGPSALTLEGIHILK